MSKVTNLQDTPVLLSTDSKSLTNLIEHMLDGKGGGYFLPTTEAVLASLPGSGLPQVEVHQPGVGPDKDLFTLEKAVKVGMSSGTSIWSDLLGIVYRGRSGDIWKELRTIFQKAERIREAWLQAGDVQISCYEFARLVTDSPILTSANPINTLSAQKVLAASMKPISDVRSLQKLLAEYNAIVRMKFEDVKQWKSSLQDLNLNFDAELTRFRDWLGELEQGFNKLGRPDQIGVVKRHWATMESLKRRSVNMAFAVDQIQDQMPRLDAFATKCGTWAARIEVWVLDICGSVMCGEAEDARTECHERESLLIEESAVSSIGNANIQAPREYLEVETIKLGDEKIL